MNEVEFDREMDAVGTAITTSDFTESAFTANEDEGGRPSTEHDDPVQSATAPIPGNAEFLQLLLGRLSAEVFKRPPSVR
jgi:hypothetical protein